MRHYVLGLALLGGCLALGELQAQPKDVQLGDHWLTDLGKGFTQSRESGKPLMVVFR